MKELRTWPDWSVASTTNQATEPLVKLALLHHQFKAIHPFHGGNGRTGRILNLLFLLQQRRLDIPVLYMLDAIETTSRATLEKVDAILALIADTVEKIRSARPALPARELAEVLFAQPSARIVRRGASHRQAADGVKVPSGARSNRGAAPGSAR